MKKLIILLIAIFNTSCKEGTSPEGSSSRTKDPIASSDKGLKKITYNDFLAFANQNQMVGPLKLEIVDETKVSESLSPESTPNGKSLAIRGSFSRNVLGELILEEQRFDTDSYVENLKNTLLNINQLPDMSKNDREMLTFMRDRFDFIYIAYADPKDGNIRRIDIQQALRGN
ncbi:hypothetical protein N8503_01685 [Akkermansiaceae bacterium]|nr:hypothetical protein [Akkermansiaceae bacterium]